MATRQDETLASRVWMVLSSDRLLGGLPFAVHAAHGVVFLRGRVDSTEQSHRAETLASSVLGVSLCHNQLAVLRRSSI